MNTVSNSELEDIDLSDIPEQNEEFFKRAKMQGPLIQKGTVLLDLDIYEWFQTQDAESQRRVNQLLREYMQSQQRSSSAT
jgi:uncharacterized protein (DUF4415 family)